MKKPQLFFMIILTVIISSLTTVGLFKILEKNTPAVTVKQEQPIKFANLAKIPVDAGQPIDFTHAARITTPGVVHVTSEMTPKQSDNQVYNPFRDLFGDDFWGWGVPPKNYQPQPRMSSGSGVIISPDGFIVTNNHVVKDADKLTVVTFDNKKYEAEVIGIDPSTDIALIKINDTDLPFIPFANSDSLEIGAWVLAVGNPFNLSSTVTAGIVSAKGRNINILEDQTAIESFIQTDAAVNPGNSGGALVDLYGRLVGINTAIASPTGTYAGYSFAVPANLVRKVVRDLKEFGIVQRGFLGVTIRNIDADLADELGLRSYSGVYVEEVLTGSAADDAGIHAKDIITTINGVPVNTSPQLQEVVAQYRPGEKLNITYIRDSKERTATVTLKNKDLGTEFLSKENINVLEDLGVSLSEPTKKELEELGITGGVKVEKIGNGRIQRYTDMRSGFIITKIDKNTVDDVDDVVRLLKEKKGGVMIEGVYPGYKGTYYYAFGM